MKAFFRKNIIFALFHLFMMVTIVAMDSKYTSKYPCVTKAFLMLPKEHNFSFANRTLRTYLRTLSLEAAENVVQNIFDKKREDLRAENSRVLNKVMGEFNADPIDKAYWTNKKIKYIERQLFSRDLSLLATKDSFVYGKWVEVASKVCLQEFTIDPAQINWGLIPDDEESAFASVASVDDLNDLWETKYMPLSIGFNKVGFKEKIREYGCTKKEQIAILEHIARHELTHAVEGHHFDYALVMHTLNPRSEDEYKKIIESASYKKISHAHESMAEIFPALMSPHAAQCSLIASKYEVGYEWTYNDRDFINSLWRVLQEKRDEEVSHLTVKKD